MANEDEHARYTPAKRLVSVYGRVIDALAGFTMGVVVVVMGVQVFFRYVLNDSIVWAEEVCRYMLIVMTFLLVGAAFQRGELVGIHFFMNALPPRLRKLMMIPVYGLMVLFLGVTAFYGYRYATFNARFTMPAVDFILTRLTGREVTQALSMYWIYMLIPVGCTLLAGHLAVAAWRQFRDPSAVESA